jgi:hypothetical protein
MNVNFNPLKLLAALATMLLLAAAPLQLVHAVGLGQGKVSHGKSTGGTLRDTPDEEQQPTDDATQAQDEEGGDPSAETPTGLEPEEASDEAADTADYSEESAEESEHSTDDGEDSAEEDQDFEGEDE